VLKAPALQIRLEFLLDVPRQRLPFGRVLIPKLRILLSDKPIEQRPSPRAGYDGLALMPVESDKRQNSKVAEFSITELILPRGTSRGDFDRAMCAFALVVGDEWCLRPMRIAAPM
jgi:hypothetical protein